MVITLRHGHDLADLVAAFMAKNFNSLTAHYDTASGFLIGEVFGRGRSPLKLFTSLDVARIVFYIVNDRIRQSIAVVKVYFFSFS